MNTPKVTALITVYNGETCVLKALRSLLDQSEKDIEVLVINDGSTDNTSNILKGIQDHRLKILNVPRMGRAGALALACREAKGRYIANLDADDISYPERLEKQAAFLDANPDIAWVGTGEEQEDSRRQEHYTRVYPPTNQAIRLQSAKCVPYCHSSVMFRKSLMEEDLNYDPVQPYLIDFEFFQRVAAEYKVANLPEILVKRIVSGESYFQSSFKTSRQNLRLAWLCALAVGRFHLPIRYYFFPFARLFYPLIPNNLKRWFRGKQGLTESHD